MILAADVGGTSTRLALMEATGPRLTRVAEEIFPSGSHRSLDEIVARFLAAHRQPIEAACFGIPGPVRDGRVTTTNLPWEVDAKRLAVLLALETVALINDLEAHAYGVAALEPADLHVLNAGAPPAAGNRAIIAAGTGLGEAGLYWDGEEYHPFASEGGHVDFAPRSEIEIDLLRFLQARLGRVSVERVVSGPGLYEIYVFLRDTGRAVEPPWLAAAVAGEDPSPVIAEAALASRSALCVEALDLFVSLYGAEAGNLALKMMATGGVYVGGGIAPKILAKLADGRFVEAFVAKGRMRPLLEAVPVHVILNEQTGLLGAARYAALSRLRRR